jgi:FkbM family methyltransferase
MTKVSICIPTYNQVKYLRQTIDSVFNQTFTDYEIIITDDSPTDIVFDLVQEYQSKGKIQYYKNAIPLGSPENWNEAIRLSKGEYVKIMHHDDYFTDENSLFEFVKMLDENPNSDFAFSAAIAISIENNKTWTHCPTNSQIERLQIDPYFLFFGNFIGPPSSIIHRRNKEIFYDINLKWVVDFDFYIQNLVINDLFVFSNKSLITSISGAQHNVTRLCENDKNIEIYEYLYLQKKIFIDKKISILNKMHINFFMYLFAKYKIKSIKDIRDTGYNLEIPFLLKQLIVINKMRIILSKIKKKIISKTTNVFNGNKFKKISFSQTGEDLIVKYIFDNLGIHNPSYIDIGAHHPYYISNTALFYKSGCRGINVEPDPTLFKEFLKFRKEDININVGIGNCDSELDFYIISASTLNTFSKEEAEKYSKQGNYTIKSIEKIKVRTLTAILNDFSNGLFPQFLSIDAEGVDEIIIKEIDFEKNFPIVICIETISFSTSGNGIKNSALIDYLVDKGYMVYADTNINTIFVKESFWKKQVK